jgi:hypothetical protein
MCDYPPMSRSPLAWLIFGTFLVAACGGGSSAPADYRGDPLCDTAQATATTASICDLSVTMHGHTYQLSCDFSQGSCDCFRDGGRIPGANQFGGTSQACTLDYFAGLWSDCCGTPR